MAKRRRLIAPDASELQELEEGFAAKPSANPFETKSTVPPIAQVAAEAASLNSMTGVTDRVALARDQGDAARWRAAEQDGLVVQMLAIADIDQDFIRRDRLVEDAEAMAELQGSIQENGLRAPIEVAKTKDGYGLISGFRRLQAYRALAAQDDSFSQIPAFVREADAGQAAYVSMVEENEVRANLSHYERGRIAVLAADQRVFPSVEAAVDALFGAASKAKRSKVRSFAKVHEALGDLLQFPTGLTEKAGLALATALRDGGQGALRDALAQSTAPDAKSEWGFLQKAIKAANTAPRDSSRGGRPQEITRIPSRDLPKGGALSAEVSADGLRIELKGRAINADTAEQILKMITRHIG
ncbi:ParB N-terminal domain-containing protein [Pseudophaeobacter sp.]|uniref:ParB/RepB/Spo0J family partition protein n=1 Tax=Pseudophaeobacter sp. TaxID=1971739 RepID=UPI00329A7F42